MHKSMFVPFTLMLMLASALVLTQIADLRIQPALATGSPQALSTVRGYFAAVDHYLETGDLSGVRTIVSPSLLGGLEPDNPKGGLEHYLKSLRQTYPALSIDIASLHVAEDVVTAHIEVETGPHANLDRIQPLNALRSWQATETFEVQGNQIVGHWTSGPGLGLFVSNPHSSVDLSLPRASHAVTARLTFDSESTGHVSIPSPALLIVERGQIRVEGNGVASIFSEQGLAGEVTSPGVDALAASGDAIVVDAARAVLSNGAQMQATLLAMLFIPSENAVQSREDHSNHDLLVQLLEHADGGAIGEGMTITPLERVSEAIDAGPVPVLSGWAVLTAGGAVAIREAAIAPIILPLVGSPVIEHDPMNQAVTVRNPESRQALVWVVLIG